MSSSNDALRALNDHGFQYVIGPGYTSNGKEIPFTLLYVRAWGEAPFIDLVHLRAEDDATALRVASNGPNPNLFARDNIVWSSRDGGDLVEVVTDLLAVPKPGEPHAPTLQVREPSRMWLPEQSKSNGEIISYPNTINS
ncbi:hypothetical protein GCM10022243_64460 [Saccharothrix violaceirubra]|uniref:Uncharacterized protein n=1 Tax=Saccharothrix violaceirubra TaxID=413306 RepID=A0A7W7T9L6_9PSEU|nr:hypothetical protein [Saccharothrix violaceirubra]MBB4969069.1 hypothetical protein [Saccharothrix violaceirubra]